MYCKNPMGKLFIDTLSKQEVMERFLGGVYFVNNKFGWNKVENVYPEAHKQIKKRVESLRNHMENTANSNDSIKKVVLCFSHGELVDNYAYMGGGEGEPPHYCAISGY